MSETTHTQDVIVESIVRLAEKATTKLFKKIADVLADDVKKEQINTNRAFREYMQNCCEKYGMVKTILYRDEPKPLYDFFVCPNIRYSDKIISASNVEKVLKINPRSRYYILQGTGGIGKSTLLKHFMLNAISLNNYVPVMIELKEFNKTDESFEDWILLHMTRLGFSLERKYFHYALETGCFLFLFDGYDELTEKRQSDIFVDLNKFCDQYGNNYYLLSTRPLTEEALVSFQRFTRIDTVPMDKKQAIDMIKKLNFDEEMKNQFIVKLESDLFETHVSFASNPLLLTIMLITFDQYAEIPQKKYIFYNCAFEALYMRHDATKGGYKREFKSKLDIDSFKKILSGLCFSSYIQRKLDFTRDELIEILIKVIQRNGLSERHENVLDDMCTALCLLYLDGREYRFIHRSFQEYFSALYIKDLSDDNYSYACRSLLKEGRARLDQVVDMIRDMNYERFEQLIVIPIMEEIEDGVPENLRYQRYKDTFVKRVSTHRTKEGRHGIALTVDDYRLSLLLDESRYHQRERPDTSAGEIYFAKLAEKSDYFRKDDGKYVAGRKKFSDYTELYEALDNTWIGVRMKFISELLPILKEKKRKNDIELLSLLN